VVSRVALVHQQVISLTYVFSTLIAIEVGEFDKCRATETPSNFVPVIDGDPCLFALVQPGSDGSVGAVNPYVVAATCDETSVLTTWRPAFWIASHAYHHLSRKLV
jgi:hypothetical protein